MKTYLISIVALCAIALVLVFGFSGKSIHNTEHKNAAYVIDGQVVQLVDGKAETESAPNSSSKTITRYIESDFVTDLNDDGREDVVFLLTQETGGSGTFFYVVAALNTPRGYVGSDGYFLGDRIVPQAIEESQNPRHKSVIVVNYLDHTPDDPMVAEPRVKKSAYLKLDVERVQWGIVAPDFEGESAI